MRVSKSMGVRKGAWTQDEDILLRKCIEKYGEGKWHQVPLKAGLNRCRKSCRLRWLNYLKPDIKRGEFAVDEVDLLIRLHKLLGNRWSLIAGRIPGRTANDVKNYWNTHMQKKIAPPKEKPKPNVIKPRARTFSRNQHSSTGLLKSSTNNIPSREINFSHSPLELPPMDDGSQWWNDLFDDKEHAGGDGWCFGGSGGDGWCFGGSDDGDDQQLAGTFLGQQTLGEDSMHEGPNAWSDFSIDMDIWRLLNSDQALM